MKLLAILCWGWPLGLLRLLLMAWLGAGLVCMVAAVMTDTQTVQTAVTALVAEQTVALPDTPLVAGLIATAQGIKRRFDSVTVHADLAALPPWLEPALSPVIAHGVPWLHLWIELATLLWLRFCLFLSALPLFLLLGGVALMDGGVMRAKRRAIGARESALRFQWAWYVTRPSVYYLLLLYVLLPWVVNTQRLLLPALLWFSVAVWLSAHSFKKYL